LRGLFKNPKDIISSTKTLLEEKHALERKVEVFQQEQANVLKDKLAMKVVKQNGYS